MDYGKETQTHNQLQPAYLVIVIRRVLIPCALEISGGAIWDLGSWSGWLLVQAFQDCNYLRITVNTYIHLL